MIRNESDTTGEREERISGDRLAGFFGGLSFFLLFWPGFSVSSSKDFASLGSLVSLSHDPLFPGW